MLVAGIATTPVPVEVHQQATESAEASGRQICAEAAGDARRLGVKVEEHTVPSDPAEALISMADHLGADLLVVGNRGMSGVRRFVLGSVPNKVSHHCRCHLMIVNTC